MKMCRENPYLVKIEQKYWAVYVKTIVHFIAVSDIFLHEGTVVRQSAFMLFMVSCGLTIHTQRIVAFLLQHWLHVCTIKLVIHTWPNLFV